MKRHSRAHVYYQRGRWIDKRSRLLSGIDYHWWLWDHIGDRFSWKTNWLKELAKLEDGMLVDWRISLPPTKAERQLLTRPRRHRVNQLVRMGKYENLPTFKKDAWWFW